MAYRLTAQTNKGSYRPAYYHLNEHHDLGWSAKAVAGKFRLSPSGDDGDSGKRWLYITTSRPVTESELIRGILWQLAASRRRSGAGTHRETTAGPSRPPGGPSPPSATATSERRVTRSTTK